MRCTVSVGELRKALLTASHITPAVPAQPAFSGVLMRVRGDELTILGSDGDTTIAARVRVDSADNGQILIPPRPLSLYLGNVPADAAVELNAESDVEMSATVGNGAPYRFRGIAATFPVPGGSRSTPVQTDLSRLGDALAAVRPCAGRDAPVVQLVSKKDSLTLHATDNFRLGRAVLPGAGLGEEFSVVLSSSVLDRVARSQVTSAQAEQNGRILRFFGPSVAVSTRVLAVSFPSVEQILSVVPPNSAVVPADLVRPALQRLASVERLPSASDSAPLVVTISDDHIELAVENADLGTGREVIPIDSPPTGTVSLALNLTYLADALASAGDSAKIEWSSATDTVYVRGLGDLEVTTAIMPMRI
jgi:DNA polymerase-3 subunit beta